MSEHVEAAAAQPRDAAQLLRAAAEELRRSCRLVPRGPWRWGDPDVGDRPDSDPVPRHELWPPPPASGRTRSRSGRLSATVTPSARPRASGRLYTRVSTSLTRTRSTRRSPNRLLHCSRCWPNASNATTRSSTRGPASPL